MSTEILPHNIPALSQEARDSNSIRIPYSPLRFWRGYPSCEMMNNGLKRWKILLLLYTKEINKLWNCFLSSSGYSNMGKKCKYGWFFKGHQWCWYRFPNCNFPPDFGPLCNGFFFQIIPCTMCIFLYKTPYNLGFVSEAKKYENNVRTYNVVYISGRSS